MLANCIEIEIEPIKQPEFSMKMLPESPQNLREKRHAWIAKRNTVVSTALVEFAAENGLIQGS